ncbi:MAG: carbonic anhydrase [Lachnospiraceae bacterium]|nr:carbonic anhydrase [Lachnospiraceae bacterium]
MINYKSIIKSRRIRLGLLRGLAFVPDKLMICLQYKIKTGRKLNLKDPKRFTEKLQWYKLYYKDPRMIQCADKYEVREFVKERGLEEILIPCYGVYDNVGSINWEELPMQFVLKDTLGCGGNEVVIVTDKNEIELTGLKKKLGNWLSVSSRMKSGGREWPYYSGKKHRVIAEGYLQADDSEQGLADYKFFCFDGEPKYVYVVAGRKLGQSAELGIFDENMQRLSARRADEKELTHEVKVPSQFAKMKEVARILSKGFPEVRIDLYEVAGEVRFGEMTFFDGSGYMTFEPDSFDEVMGSAFHLPAKQ